MRCTAWLAMGSRIDRRSLASQERSYRFGGGETKYLQQPASGYEGLVQFGGSVLQDRIIFGTSYPLVPVERSVKEVEELPLKDHVKRKWLHDNAARFLGLA